MVFVAATGSWLSSLPANPRTVLNDDIVFKKVK